MRERFKNGYVKLGVTIFLAGSALIIVYEMVANLEGVSEGFDRVTTIVSPFIFGLVMAYLLCPVYNVTVRKSYRLTTKWCKSKKNAFRLSRVLATVASLITLIGVVGGLFALVLPELIKSIINLVETLPNQINELIDWVEFQFADNKHPQLMEFFEATLLKLRDRVTLWAQDEFLPQIGMYMSQISQGVIVTLKTMLNILIGIIVCVYFLNNKELFKAQMKKTISATLPKEKSDAVLEFAYFTNGTFGGFINGKLIDSLIMGILCFIVMSVINLPYTILVSTIVGVTNFIPFFGPFIGAIPSSIIICIDSPIKAVYFLIMILVLQQIDGNIIGPKILGGTTGLASFWVMFAIIVGGGLFGFMGMVLGVPVFAVIYYYTARYIEKRLKKKQMPVETADYQDYNKYDINRRDLL